MNRDEFDAWNSILRKSLIVGVCFLAVGCFYIAFGNLSTKGDIIVGLWLTLVACGTGKAIHGLCLCGRIETKGLINEENTIR